MLYDLQTTFSGTTAADGTRTAQTVLATAISTNIIDLRSATPGFPPLSDEGIDGTDLYLFVRTVAAFNNLTSITITLESDSTANLATAPFIHYSRTFLLAALGAGQELIRLQVPSDTYKRFLGVRYTLAGTAPTTGSFFSGMVMAVPQLSQTIFPGNFVVA